MTSDRRDEDMGDDPQESEIAEYELYEQDPPNDLIIGEAPDGGSIGISEWTAEESSVRSRARERRDDDDRSAEQAAVEPDQQE